jgi:hypothetical protein
MITKFEQEASAHPECIAWYTEVEDREVPYYEGRLFIQSDRNIFCFTGDFEGKALVSYSYRALASIRDQSMFERESEALIDSLRLR